MHSKLLVRTAHINIFVILHNLFNEVLQSFEMPSLSCHNNVRLCKGVFDSWMPVLRRLRREEDI